MGRGARASTESPKRGLLAAGILGYLAGSFPTADLVAKYLRRRDRDRAIDLREAGSGNPGAVNATTVLGKRRGLAVLAGDMIKGAAAVLLGRAAAGDNGAYMAGTAAVAGHCYPPWSGFRGGKGVATSFATALVCFPPYAPVDVAVFTASFFLSKGRASLAKEAPDAQLPARASALLASGVFCASAVYWWLKDKGNLWGPRPTLGLPLYAFATSGILALRLLTWPATAKPETSGEASATVGDAGAPATASHTRTAR